MTELGTETRFDRRNEVREELVKATCLELADHLRDCAQNGRSYIREYAEYMVAPKRLTSPPAQKIHPLLAQLIREIMRDAEIVRRLAG